METALLGNFEDQSIFKAGLAKFLQSQVKGVLKQPSDPCLVLPGNIELFPFDTQVEGHCNTATVGLAGFGRDLEFVTLVEPAPGYGSSSMVCCFPVGD